LTTPWSCTSSQAEPFTVVCRKGGKLHLPQLAVPDDLIAKWPAKSFGARRGRPTIPQPLPLAEIVRIEVAGITLNLTRD
jgi:hypothetical protein